MGISSPFSRSSAVQRDIGIMGVASLAKVKGRRCQMVITSKAKELSLLLALSLGLLLRLGLVALVLRVGL